MTIISRIGLAVVICVLLAGFTDPGGHQSSSNSGSYERLLQLDQLIEGLYLAASDGNRQTAFQYVQQIERFYDNAAVRLKGSPEGWKEMRRNLQQAKDEFDKPENAQRWREPVSSLKLAADALLHDKGALWTEYESLLQEDLRRLDESWRRHTPDASIAASAAFRQLTEHASRMRTAALLIGEPELVRSLYDRIRYAGRLINAAEQGKAEREWVEASFQDIGEAAQALFQDNRAKAAELGYLPRAGGPAWQWTVLIGLPILAALFYAGWRKYTIDRDEVTIRKR